jgi:CheY-like chemotaxis protein
MQPPNPCPDVFFSSKMIPYRFPMAEALRDLGISVVEAATADEAWEHLRVAASAVDLVFTDYNMPGSMTGEELASRIGQQYPGMATVITSGGSGGPLDPSRFLEKPYDLFQLRTLSRRGSVDKAVSRAAEVCEDGPAITKPYEHQLVLDGIRQSLAQRHRHK